VATIKRFLGCLWQLGVDTFLGFLFWALEIGDLDWEWVWVWGSVNDGDLSFLAPNSAQMCENHILIKVCC